MNDLLDFPIRNNLLLRPLLFLFLSVCEVSMIVVGYYDIRMTVGIEDHGVV